MHRAWETEAVFNFQSPRVVFGPGTVSRVGAMAKDYGVSRAVVVADAIMARAGHLDKVVTSLQGAGIAVEVFDSIDGEPTVDMVRKGVAFCQGKGVEAVIALGGGSAIDGAKAINVVLANGGDPRDYLYGRRRATDPGLPFIAIATTAGTAADISAGAVIGDPETGIKENFVGAPWRTALAICDPELTVTVPPKVTAYNGVDALGHAIDSYTNKNFNPISDAIDLQVMQLVAQYLPQAMAKGDDLTARSAVMFAASSAGYGFSQRGTGLTHGISHPLGVHGHLPHGLTISLLLPFVMEYNLDWCVEKLADVAAAMGVRKEGQTPRESAVAAVDAVRSLCRGCGLPQRLSEAGVSRDSLPLIARETVTQRRANVAINPRAASEAQVLELLRLAY